MIVLSENGLKLQSDYLVKKGNHNNFNQILDRTEDQIY